jgi:hypothetical protein
MVGNHNWLSNNLLERGPDSLIECGPALKADMLADFSPADDTIEIIFHDRIAQASDKLIGLGALLLVAEEV